MSSSDIREIVIQPVFAAPWFRFNLLRGKADTNELDRAGQGKLAAEKWASTCLCSPPVILLRLRVSKPRDGAQDAGEAARSPRILSGANLPDGKASIKKA